MSEHRRKGDQALDAEIEARIAEINDRLSGAFEDPDARVSRPVIFVVGHQRSGSTLVSQIIAAGSEVGYPSNLIARFWRSPVAGITLQRALAGQLGPLATSYRSTLGTTEHLLEPHEFSYFWNEWFPEETRCRDEEGLRVALGNMERAFALPLAFKNVFNSLRVDVLGRLFPTAIFVVVRRDLLDIACSTLDARRRRFGTDAAWFGVRPAACEAAGAASMEPAQQIACQLTCCEEALERGIAAVGHERVIELSYPDVCARPRNIVDALAARGIAAREDAALPASFPARETSSHHPDAARLRAALEARVTGREQPG